MDAAITRFLDEIREWVMGAIEKHEVLTVTIESGDGWSLSFWICEIGTVNRDCQNENLEMTGSRLRAAWRALFDPEPPGRLDGWIIQLRTLSVGKWTSEEWHRQNAIRGEENRQRNLAWKRGEKL